MSARSGGAPTVRAPLLEGSHEQLLLNPPVGRLRELNREISRAEEHFGMTPLARLRLDATYPSRAGSEGRPGGEA